MAWKVRSIQKMTAKYKGTPRPAVVFSGRSNCGKSSLINSLLGKKIAQTSKTPGRTRGVHRFFINERYDMIDLPGYGFAKVGAELRGKWRGMITNFLSGHDNIRQLLVLVDIRRGIQDIDMEMLDWADREGVEPSIILTKADKLKKTHRIKALKEVKETLGGNIKIIPVSVTKAIGLDELKRLLELWYSEDAFEKE